NPCLFLCWRHFFSVLSVRSVVKSCFRHSHAKEIVTCARPDFRHVCRCHRNCTRTNLWSTATAPREAAESCLDFLSGSDPGRDFACCGTAGDVSRRVEPVEFSPWPHFRRSCVGCVQKI